MRAGLGAGCLSAVLMLLPGCVAMRTREFAADRAGATAAIHVLLKQDKSASINATLKKAPAPVPTAAWRAPLLNGVPYSHPDYSGVVVVDVRDGVPADERAHTFAPTQAGLLAAGAYAKEVSSGRWIMVRLPYAAIYREVVPNAWGWIGVAPSNVMPFDTGVCFRDRCFEYADIRTVMVATPDAEAGPFQATRAGLLAAMADPLAETGQVLIETSLPQSSISKASYFYTVSVLEDARICGTAAEYPLAAKERCYAYTEIEGFEVWDRNATARDVLSDVAMFPFRLVGGAAAAIAMGGG